MTIATCSSNTPYLSEFTRDKSLLAILFKSKHYLLPIFNNDDSSQTREVTGIVKDQEQTIKVKVRDLGHVFKLHKSDVRAIIKKDPQHSILNLIHESDRIDRIALVASAYMGKDYRKYYSRCILAAEQFRQFAGELKLAKDETKVITLDDRSFTIGNTPKGPILHLEKILGVGSAKKVINGINLKTFEEVAINIITGRLHPEQRSLDLYTQNVLLETKAMKSAQIEFNFSNVFKDVPGFINIYNISKFGRQYILYAPIYELSLYEAWKNTPNTKKKNIVVQIVKAMMAMHAKNYAHRDIKPANIRMNYANEVVLIDYELSTAPDSIDHQLRGTGIYLPCRMLSSIHRFDYYALGITLLELKYGECKLPRLEDNQIAQELTSLKGLLNPANSFDRIIVDLLSDTASLNDILYRLNFLEPYDFQGITKTIAELCKYGYYSADLSIDQAVNAIESAQKPDTTKRYAVIIPWQDYAHFYNLVYFSHTTQKARRLDLIIKKGKIQICEGKNKEEWTLDMFVEGFSALIHKH